jgi:hypothetical protein
MFITAHAACAGPKIGQTLAKWNFDTNTQGWQAANDCTLQVKDGVLNINATGHEPYLYSPPISINGPVAVRIRAKCALSGQGRLYWTVMLPSMQSSPWGEDSVVYFDLIHDGQWHEYTIPIDIDGKLTQMRFDPAKTVGQTDVAWVELDRLGEDSSVGGAIAGLPAKVSIADGPISATLETGQHRFTVTDARTGRQWRSVPSNARILDARKTGKNAMALSIRDRISGLTFACTVSVRKDGVLTFDLDTADRSAKFDKLIYPPRFEAELGKGALLFTDRCCGVLIDQKDTGFPQKSFFCYSNIGLDMPWFGVVDLKRGDGMMVLFETPTDVAVDLRADEQGRQWPQTRWVGSMGIWSYPRRVSYRFSTSGGYVALAKMYRAYAQQIGQVKTLAQKAKERPNVARLKGAALVWGSTGLKFAREAHAAGMSRAVVYDFGQPQASDLRQISDLGFLTGHYDCYTDILNGPVGTNSDNIEKTAYRTPDGKPLPGWRMPDGLQYYTRSSSRALSAAKHNIPLFRQVSPFSTIFLDVSATIDLFEDYHPDHRFDRRQDMKYRIGLYDYMTKLGLVTAGEHGKAWNAMVVDYTEGMASGPFWWEMPAGYLIPPKTRADIKGDYLNYGCNYTKLIPLWQLVFHDCVANAWYWGDSSDYYYAVAPESSDRKDLTNMLYGTMPLMWSNTLGYGWDRNRARFLETYRNTCKLNEVTAFDQMLSHEFLSEDRAVQRSRFSGGAVVVVNYSDQPKPYRDAAGLKTLAPRGFYAHAPGFEQFRLIDRGGVVTRICGSKFLFVQTEKRQSVGPVELQGKVTAFEESPGRWHLVVESEHESIIDLKELIATSARKGTSLFELSDDGGMVRQLPTDIANGVVRIPGGKGIRLFAVLLHPQDSLLILPQRNELGKDEKVELFTGRSSGTVRYTLDGTEPTSGSPVYASPLPVQGCVTVKAAIFGGAKRIGRTVSASYVRSLFESGVMRGGDPAKRVSVSVAGAGELRLLVDDGGDGTAYDHANWADAKLVSADGSVTYLSDLKPVVATQGNGTLQRDHNLEGKPIEIAGQRFARGLCTHAFSTIVYTLNGKYDRFESWVGVDDYAVRDHPGEKNGSVGFHVIITPGGK